LKVYEITRTQFLPIPLEKAWDFFCSPHNLIKITPSRMNFKILSPLEEKMFAGQTIIYKVNILPFVRIKWVTEITEVKHLVYFVDEQKAGPYALWRHKHSFKEIEGGVEMIDTVSYAISFGWIGRLANWLFVAREVESIFNFRNQVLKDIFPDRIDK
jgi:ligand-binding SRPBCC domain-containing protein